VEIVVITHRGEIEREREREGRERREREREKRGDKATEEGDDKKDQG
jgi:hypothetical protein